MHCRIWDSGKLGFKKIMTPGNKDSKTFIYHLDSRNLILNAQLGIQANYSSRGLGVRKLGFKNNRIQGKYNSTCSMVAASLAEVEAELVQLIQVVSHLLEVQVQRLW